MMCFTHSHLQRRVLLAYSRKAYTVNLQAGHLQERTLQHLTARKINIHRIEILTYPLPWYRQTLDQVLSCRDGRIYSTIRLYHLIHKKAKYRKRAARMLSTRVRKMLTGRSLSNFRQRKPKESMSSQARRNLTFEWSSSAWRMTLEGCWQRRAVAGNLLVACCGDDIHVPLTPEPRISKRSDPAKLQQARFQETLIGCRGY